MSIEMTTEALQVDLCSDKFEEEMDTVDLVDTNASVKSEEEAVPTGKRRGRPKKVESPVTDGTIITISNKCAH